MASDLFTRAQQFVAILPHARHLGMEVISAADGTAVMRMPYSENLIGDPRTKVIFGGAVSCLLDTTGGLAVLAHDDAHSVMATLDLRVDYMRAATPGQAITATATCYHVARSVAFVRATATDDNTDTPVATAAGAFSLSHDQKPSA